MIKKLKHLKRNALERLTPPPSLWTLLRYAKPHRRSIVFGIAFLLAANFLKLATAFVLRYAIDELLNGMTHLKALSYGSTFVALVIVQGVFLFLQRRTLVFVARDIEFHLRNDFFAHLQKLGIAFYHTRRTGDLMSRATSDLNAVRSFTGLGFISACNALFALIFILPAMISISWRLALIALIPLPLLFLATRLVSKRIHDRSAKVQESYGAVSSSVQEALAGVRVARAYGQEQALGGAFDQVSREFLKENMSLIRLSVVFSPILQFLVGSGSILVFWFGGRLIFQGAITVGQFLQFSVYMGYLLGPTIALSGVLNLYQRAMASLARLDAIMSIEPVIRDRETMLDVKEIGGAVEFRELTFAYTKAGAPVLSDINLHISPGQTIAFVGPVGSGKSTLMNLVPRLLEAPPETVLIDGHPVRDIPLKVLRSSIGYVPQETILFSGTVRENISFGVEDVAPGEVECVAREAEIAAEIEGLPQGYDTVIGERGVTLSGGQKQRAAIARALLRKPRILILDDALSAVDSVTEERILQHLRRVTSDCTNLIVSHRLSSVKNADLIVVIDDGCMVECGTHEELLAREGLYASLHHKQMLAEELEVTL